MANTLKKINTKEFDFDIVSGVKERISFFQHETTATIILNFKNKSEAFDLTGISEVKAYMIKPDDTKCFISGVVTDAVNGEVQFTLTNNILAVAGKVSTTIVMYEGSEDNKIYPKFNIYCGDSEYDEDAIESTNEFSALQEAIEQAQTGGVGAEKVKEIIKGLIADGELEVQAYDDTEIRNIIGSLDDLTTTDKSNLVAAINEAKESGGGGIDFLTDAEMDALEIEIFG